MEDRVLTYEPYEEDKHAQVYYDMFIEYGKGLDQQVVETYGYHLFPDGDVAKLAERLVPRFTSINPSEEVLLLFKVDGEVAGTARLDKFEDNIGMVHQVFIYPNYRGKGYSKKLMYVVEDWARKFGYTYLRLDTGGFNARADEMGVYY